MPRAKRLARKTIYRDPWVTLHVDRVRLPNGHVIDRFHFLDFETAAVGVIVEDARGRLLMEKVYRYTTDTTSWEIPAGGMDPGESAAQAARREVFEETGYRVRNPKVLYSYHPTNGTSNKRFYIVKAIAVAQEGPVDPHEVEALKWFTRAELRQLLRRKQLRDGLTLSALVFLGNGVSV